MAVRQTHDPVAKDQRGPQHLSNERTFLAWVRTSIALVSLGFVLARVGPSLAQRAAASSSHAARAVPVGISLISLGAVLTVLAAWRHSRVNREIENGMVKTGRGLVVFVTAAIVLLAVAAITYMAIATNVNDAP
jgi:putative membrane protein